MDRQATRVKCEITLKAGDHPVEPAQEGLGLNARVQQLERKLEEVQNGVQQFVGMLAHELRSPLGAILMWAHVLRLGREGDREVALDAIESSARDQSLAIGTLLDLTRGLAGQLSIPMELLDLLETVQLAAAESQPMAESANVALEVRLDPGGRLPVRGDALRLRRMVAGLIRHAIRATPAGATVEIDAGVLDGSLAISIRDAGPHRSSQELEEIFTPFRLQGEVPRGLPGRLGLDLPFARLMAELHQGTAIARNGETQPGQVIAPGAAGPGCTIIVTIPLAALPLAALPAAGLPAAGLPPGAGLRPPHS